ncbi:MAG TPA: PP2C family protein-serine/threonine phosphatase [Pyrinomonadaceae bacterium]|nr:PP2C family protein-serine/threonine phosphatase [Pyrinomonadaceae bacterium]
MNAQPIQSEAFRRAALKSESYRIIGLLCVLCATLVFAIARDLLAGEYRLLVTQALLLSFAVGGEAVVLSIVKRASRLGRDVPTAVWVLNVLMESLFPTVGLLLLTESQFIGPYRSLVAPAVLGYFLFIILSTLRLSPILSVLTGIFSALGYIAITLYTFARYPNPDSAAAVFPRSVYFFYAGLILTGGIIAAAVAGQIRSHVLAALREAELQRELERVNHDLDIARSIQQGLLPSRSPKLSNFDLAGWNQPADQTGGDYFDYQELPDGRLAVSLADVTGHGIGPALVMSACRAYARSNFLSNGDPTTVLDHLNQLLFEDLPSERFVTFAVALIDSSESKLQMLSAGQGPLLVYRAATREVEHLEAQGIPLGLLPGFKYGLAVEVGLAPGDMFVLVTDGFYEWENPQGEDFGFERLETVLREACDYSAAEVIQRLHAAVINFCQGTKQMDDLTAVVLKRNK